MLHDHSISAPMQIILAVSGVNVRALIKRTYLSLLLN